MTHQFECPVCEQQFEISNKSPDKKVKCPGCSHRFKPTKKKTVRHSKPAPIPLASSAPLPTATPQLPRPTTRETDAGASRNPAEKETSQVRPNKASKAVFAASKRKRVRQQKLRGIATIIGLALIIGILSGFLIMRLRSDNKLALNEVARELDTENLPTADGHDPEQSAASRTSTFPESAKKPKQIRHGELKPREFVYHNAKQVDQCWNQIHPHLVKLTVHDGLGSHPAVGTIVDSRGWILTSYSTIKGASKIEVASGYKTIDQYYQDAKLTDTVRGIIVSDPEQDIAVLSVNRRFVESFAEVVITQKDFVVEGEFMLQCAPPNPESAHGCYESKVGISGKFDRLREPGKSLAEKMKLASTELSWIVCPDKQKAVPGSPLVRIDGSLEAIHVFSKDDKAHYVSVHLLKPMLADAVDRPQPLSSLQDNGRFAVDIDHPLKETSVLLNLSSDVCKQFDWIPKDQTQYQQLREFSGHFAKAIKLVKKNQDSNPELVKEIHPQIKQIEDSISLGIKNNRTPVEAMNQFAAIELKQSQPLQVIPFFGSVADLDVSAGNDVLELEGTNPATIIGLNPSQGDRFQRGEFCLAFIQIPEVPSSKSFEIRGKTTSCTIVDLVTRISVSRPTR